MKTISISIDEILFEKLKHFVPAKKVSKFVSTIIKCELEKAEQKLSLAYEQAEQDVTRQELLSEWDAIDDFNKE